jgi:hypothetical protein
MRHLVHLICAGFLALPGSVHAEPAADFTVPNAPWRMTLAMSGASLRTHELKPGGDIGAFLLTRKDGLDISIFIEPAKDCKTAQECRDRLWKSVEPKLAGATEINQSQIGAAFTIEFLLPKLNNIPVHQKNVYAEFVADGYWVDVRLSKGAFKPEDQARFAALIESVAFVRKP